VNDPNSYLAYKIYRAATSNRRVGAVGCSGFFVGLLLLAVLATIAFLFAH
jgi:hypothetical protein